MSGLVTLRWSRFGGQLGGPVNHGSDLPHAAMSMQSQGL